MTENRVGEVRRANNGQLMKIIRYGGCNDIDVQFEDSTIVYGTRYQSFKIGTIRNRNVVAKYTKAFKSGPSIGESITNIYGDKMTIIHSDGYGNIDVQFEDGTISYHKTYGAFKQRRLKKPNNKNRLGETVLTNSGQRMTIIAYKNSFNIDIQFEDGTIVKEVTYESFKNGRIKNPNRPHSSKKKYR